MSKGPKKTKPWSYRSGPDWCPSLWFDDGTPGGRNIWLESKAPFQVGLAKLLVSELNRARVRLVFDAESRKVKASHKP